MPGLDRSLWLARTLCALLIVVCLTCRARAQAHSGAREQDTAGREVGAWGDADDSLGFAEATTEDGAENADDAAGFAEVADDASESQPPPDAAAESPAWALRAFHRLVLGAWVQRLEDQPLASARNELYLELAYRHAFAVGSRRGALQAQAAGQVYYDFAYRFRRELYDQATLERYEVGQIPRAIFVALTLGPFRLATGRQVISWGQGEMLHVLDRVNPQDLREPGLTPPAERRVAVALTHADLALDRHRLELIVVHEVSFGLLPPPLSAMSPLRALLLELPGLEGKTLRYRHEPAPALFRPPAQQYHARWTFRAPAADFALHAASMLEPLGVPVLPEPEAFARDDLELRVVHPRFELLGASLALPWDRMLMRAELQWGIDRPIALRRRQAPLLDLSATRRDQLDALLGVTYIAGAASSLGLDVLQSYLPDHPARNDGPFDTFWPVEATQLALRVDHALLRERLRVGMVALLIGFDPVNAWAARAQASYALTDGFTLQLQFIHYQPTQHFGMFYGFRRHDRLVLSTQWDLDARF